MAIFGWICFVILVASGTFVAAMSILLGSLDMSSMLGPYSTKKEKLAAVLMMCAVGYAWYLVVDLAPFTIVTSMS